MMNKVKSEDIKAKLNIVLARLSATQNILEVISPVLKEYSRKKITKRLETALKKVFEKEGLDQYTIRIQNIGSLINLIIWNSTLNHVLSYDNRLSIFLAYSTSFSNPSESGMFDFDKLVQDNPYYFGNGIEEYKNTLLFECFPMVDELVQKNNQLVIDSESLEKQLYHFNINYLFRI